MRIAITGILGCALGWWVAGLWVDASSPIRDARSSSSARPMSSDNVENLPQNSSVPPAPLENFDSSTEGPTGPDGAEPAPWDAGTAVTVELKGLSSLEELWGLEMVLVPDARFPAGPPDGRWNVWGSAVPLELPRRVQVLPGSYQLVVARDRDIAHVAPVTVGTDPLTVQVPLPPLDRSRMAIIEVQTDEGIPLDGVGLIFETELELDDTTLSWRSSWTPLRIGPGRFIVGADERWMDDHPSAVEVRHWLRGTIVDQPHTMKSITLDLGRTEPHPLVFETRVPLYLSVLEFNNPDITPPRWISWGRGLDPKAWATVTPDLGGYARARIAPGDYTFALGGGPDHREFAQIGPDGAQISLTPPRLSRLRVTVDRSIATPGTWFALHGPRGSFGRQRLGPDGELEYGALSAEVVSLATDDGRGMLIELPVDRPIEFVPESPTAFEIQDIGTEWRTRWGLAIGDRVIAIDGLPASRFENPGAAHGSLRYAQSMTIERQGSPVVIDLTSGEPLSEAPPKLRPLFGEVR